jgi:hypothetical protein
MAEKLRVDAIDEIVVGISVLLDSDEFDVKYKGLLGGKDGNSLCRKGLEIPWSVFFMIILRCHLSDWKLTRPMHEPYSNCWASTLPQEGKALPFSDKFKTLELVVDTEKAGPGGKHPERSAELLQNIDEVLAQKQISTKTLEQLHGRIVWFRTFIFDRKFNAATRTIS